MFSDLIEFIDQDDGRKRCGEGRQICRLRISIKSGYLAIRGFFRLGAIVFTLERAAP